MELTYEALSRDAEHELVKLARKGCKKAMHALVNSITPLIKREAGKYSGKCDVAELVNEGVLAVYRALSMYDESSGYRFSTYVVGERGMVQFYIQRAVNDSHLIKRSIPTNRKYGALVLCGYDAPTSTSNNLTYADVLTDTSNDGAVMVDCDGVERDMATIDLNELIDRMPDGIEKTTIRKVANGLTMREIASDTKCSRMMPQRNTEKAIATLKKMINCRS